jgi:hypothetical protein
LTFVEFIKRRSQLGGAGVNQFDWSLLADNDPTITPQKINDRGR